MAFNYPIPVNYLGYTVTKTDRNSNIITVESDSFGVQEWELTVGKIKRDATCRICGAEFKCHQAKMFKPVSRSVTNRFHKICLSCGSPE